MFPSYPWFLVCFTHTYISTIYQLHGKAPFCLVVAYPFRLYTSNSLINLDSPKDNDNNNNSNINININIGDLMEIEPDIVLWFLIYNADFNKKIDGFHGKFPSNASW